MNKANKFIISIGICIIIAATVLIISLVDSMTEEKKPATTGIYTLQPTTTTTVPVNTDSWIDLNQIASELATVTDPSATDTSNLSTTGNGTVGYFFDAYGNLVDVNGNVIIPANNIVNNANPNNGNMNNSVTNNVSVDVNATANSNSNIQNDYTAPTISFELPTSSTTLPETTIDNTEALDQPIEGEDNEMGEFEINSDGVITKYLGDKEDIMIPDSEQGKAITGIGEGCFKDSNIRSIYIPESVTFIGDFAFENCTRLTSVSFVSNDTSVVIGTSAFQNCFALKSINLPIVSLGNSAFGNCTSLKTVKLSEGSKTIGSYCFSNCPKLATVVVPGSVDDLGTGVFEGSNNPELCIVTPSDSMAWEYAVDAGKKTNTHE